MRLLVSGRVDPLPMTTHRSKFAEIEKAFRRMPTKEGGIDNPLVTSA